MLKLKLIENKIKIVQQNMQHAAHSRIIVSGSRKLRTRTSFQLSSIN